MIELLPWIPVFWHWWALAALFLVAELLAPGLYFLWLAESAVLTGFVVLLFSELGNTHQLAVFSVLSLLSILLAQRWLKHYRTTSDEPLLNQRTARYIGQIVQLEQGISGGKGRITLDGSIWTVTGPDCPADTQARIVAVDGIILKVEPAA